MYTTKHFFILIVITALVFTGFGFFAKQIFMPKADQIDKNYPQQINLEPGLQAAYQRLLQRGQAAVVARGYGFRESKNIGGLIKEKADNQIILRVDPINPLADPALDQRTVKINAKTKIYKQVEKTSEEMNSDMQSYEKTMQAFKNKQKDVSPKDFNPEDMPTPPEPYKKMEISLVDLAVKDRLMITAEQDIHQAKEFTATEIVLQK